MIHLWTILGINACAGFLWALQAVKRFPKTSNWLLGFVFWAWSILLVWNLLTVIFGVVNWIVFTLPGKLIRALDKSGRIS